MRYAKIESVENGFIVYESSAEMSVCTAKMWVFTCHADLNEFLFKNMPTQEQHREDMKKNETNQA